MLKKLRFMFTVRRFTLKAKPISDGSGVFSVYESNVFIIAELESNPAFRLPFSSTVSFCVGESVRHKEERLF